MDTNFDSVDSKTGYKVDGVGFPLTSTIERTVGAGKDFELFHEAMTWACSIQMAGAGQIKLILDDGTHYIGEPDSFNRSVWAYYTVSNARVIVESLSGTRTDCIITIPSTDDGDQSPAIFQAVIGGALILNELTINPTIGGYPYPSHTTPVTGEHGGLIETYRVNIGPGFTAGIVLYSFAAAELTSLLLSGTDSYSWGMELNSGVRVAMQGVTIENCSQGINNAGAQAITTSTLTFTNVTTPSSLPLNEIQYNGTFTSDNTAALTLKA